MRVAAIDIGSNSVRLLVIDEDGNEITRDVTVTGLGRGIEGTGRFDPAAFSATLDVIGQYAAKLESLHIDAVRVVATSASRDAANGPELMNAVEQLVGTRPEVIDGDVEAALAFSGATIGMPALQRKLVIDIGGGSTEVVFGTESPEYATSIDMGSVRLTDRLVTERPVSEVMLSQMRHDCDRAFSDIEVTGVEDVSIGVAGTFTSLSAMAMQLDVYDRSTVHGSQLDLTSVIELVDHLSSLSIASTARIASLDPARAPVILAGAVIAERVMLRTEITSITISETDLLEGVALTMLSAVQPDS